MNEQNRWVGREDYLRAQAWACLKDLGVEMSYDEFCRWVELKLGDQNGADRAKKTFSS